jgi:hypothetical protein
MGRPHKTGRNHQEGGNADAAPDDTRERRSALGEFDKWI